MLRMTSRPRAGRRASGFSLVELLVALTIGLVLVIGMSSVYLFTKTAFSRQSQLSSLQQSVRTAFEYLGTDARMVGHMGCFTGSTIAAGTNYFNPLSVTNFATNYGLGIEGYEYTGTGVGDSYSLTSDSPANVTGGTAWATNVAASGISGANMAAALTAGRTSNPGLTPGSDVLVIRTVSGGPVRLTADTDPVLPLGTVMAIENIAGGTCNDGITAKVSGFCSGSHGLVASCKNARIFAVSSIAASTLTLPTGSFPVFPKATAEVFPMQTVAYYVAKSTSGTTTSLYRRVFNGDTPTFSGATANDGTEQELIEDVESLQVLYAVDTTSDRIIDEYDLASTVPDWGNVLAVRMSLLLRSPKAEAAGVAVAASAPVNGLAITYPAGSKYDRRVFTTTVAVRNKIY